MNQRISFLIMASLLAVSACGLYAQEDEDWPEPVAVEPGAGGNFVGPPDDAVRLFSDARDLQNWTKMNGDPIEWTDAAAGKVLLCAPGTGSIISTELFGDAQIHVEFNTPYMPTFSGQGRGNSGIYLQNSYEIQVLDSFARSTYPDGQCGAIYSQKPPDVNAARPPGQWQSYDIIFRDARFDAEGNKTENARVTVFHNGILIQNNVEILGPTGGGAPESADPGPIHLQDHGNKVKFRNIWLRHLEASE